MLLYSTVKLIFKEVFFNWLKFIALLSAINFLFLNFPIVLVVYSIYLLFSFLASLMLHWKFKK